MANENERRSQMVSKINDEVVKNGFCSLTMDGIAKIMGISRGKLYQYFSSKDEIIAAVVARYVRYIEETSVIRNSETPQEFVEEFVSIFFQNVTLAGSITDIFVNDLKNVYPDLFRSISNGIEKRNSSIYAFYEAGMTKGAFNSGMNAKLLHIQDQTMLAVLVVPQFLFTNGLSPAQSLRDYLQLRILEVIPPQYQLWVNQEQVEERILHLDEKYKRVLWDSVKSPL